jgi:Ca-activated chloride channel homolog
MNLEWYYNFSLWDKILIALFIVGSILYVWRYLSVAEGMGLRKKTWRILIKLVLRGIYFALLLLALRGPSFGYGKKYVQTIGKDIYVALDLSQSMLASDVSPSRLEKAKSELNHLIHTLPAERFGLIIFTSEAFLQCPLTLDRSVLDLYLNTVNPNLMPDKSTDIAEALRLALDKYEQEGFNYNEVKAKTVILISDGEDFGQSTNNILQKYKQLGIKIFTVGVGSSKGSKLYQANGSLKYTPEGQIVVSKLDYRHLQNIAKQTDGQYFELSSNKNELPLLISTIQNIKGQRIDTRSIDVSYNKYEYLLWTALILMLLDMLLIVKIMKL